MNKHFVRLEHEPKKPVVVERVHPDRLRIEGVLYDGDYFRTFGAPDTDVLYAVRRDEDGCVCLTVIDSLEKARQFFDPLCPDGHLPQNGEEHPILGEEEFEGDEDGI